MPLLWCGVSSEGMSYLYNLKENWLYLLVAVLCAGFFMLLPAFTSAGKNFFNVLGLIAIIFVVFKWRLILSLDKNEKIILLLIILFAGWAVLTFLVNGSPGRGSRFLWNRQIFIMVLPFAFLLLKYLNFPIKYYINVFLISSVVLLVMGAYEIIQYKYASLLDIGRYRLKGGMHPIQFGSIALIFLSFIISYVFIFRKNIYEKILALLLVLFLAVGIVYSQARGVWIALILMPVLWLMFYPSALTVFRKVIILLLLICSVLLSYFIKPVQERVYVTKKNLVAYYNSENVKDKVRGTSLGTRLEMWKASYLILKENPMFGVGLGGYESAARDISRQNTVHRSAYSFYHPHNQFFSEMASKGVPGLVIYIAILVLLLRYYILRLRDSSDRQTKFYAFFGMQLITFYAVFSLTDAVMEGKVLLLMFVMLNAMVMANLSVKEDAHE